MVTGSRCASSINWPNRFFASFAVTDFIVCYLLIARMATIIAIATMGNWVVGVQLVRHLIANTNGNQPLLVDEMA